MPKINQAGLDLIKSFEGCKLHAYPDPGSGGEPYTIGYGHTGSCAAIGIDASVTPDMTITQEQADALLQSDLSGFESGVNDLVSRVLTPNQFAALVSFAYNNGIGSLAASTLLKCVNAGDMAGAALQFKRWVYADGQILDGLVRRREAEAALFLTP